MDKMTRKEFIRSKQTKRGKHRGLFLNLTEEESAELYRKAAELQVNRTAYIKSFLFYSD